MTTKISINGVIAAVLAIVLLTPSLVSAQRPDRASTTDREARSVDVCGKIDEWRESALSKLSERAEQVRDRGDSRNGNVDTRRSDREAEFEAKRQEMEQKREEHYDSLREKGANNESLSEAIEKFISTVKDLVADRQESMDAAIAAFEEGVADLKETMQETTGSLESSVEDDLNAIFDEAEDACTDDSTVSEIRQIISEGMAEMRASRQANRDTYSFRDEFEALRAERKAAFEAAKEAFKSGLEAAKAELRETFEEERGSRDNDDGDDDEDSQE